MALYQQDMRSKWASDEKRRLELANMTQSSYVHGRGFVSGGDLERERKNKQSMDELKQTGANALAVQEARNKGGLDQTKYRQDAASNRFGDQLGFDKSKYQQTFDEDRRTGERDFGLKQSKFGQLTTEQDRRFGQLKTEQDRRFGLEQYDSEQRGIDRDRRYEMATSKNEAERNKARQDRYSSFRKGEIDEYGNVIQEPMTHEKTMERMRNEDRWIRENSEKGGMSEAGQGYEEIDETMGEDGTKSFSNAPTFDQPEVDSQQQRTRQPRKRITPGMKEFGTGISGSEADEIFPGEKKTPTSKQALEEFQRKLSKFRTSIYNN